MCPPFLKDLLNLQYMIMKWNVLHPLHEVLVWYVDAYRNYFIATQIFLWAPDYLIRWLSMCVLYLSVKN